MHHGHGQDHGQAHGDVHRDAHADVVVIGAGSAGCVVAEILSRNPARTVIVVEAGSDRDGTDPDEPTAGQDLFVAMGAPGRLWPEVTLDPGGGITQRPYLRGRGVGGSGAVNGMVLQPGAPHDYDRWAARPGCQGWSWADVSPVLERRLRGAHAADTTGLGPAERLLAAAASRWPGGALRVEPTRLALDADGRRASSDVGDLALARARANVRVLCDAPVRRLLLATGPASPSVPTPPSQTPPIRRVEGVELADGRTIAAPLVVVCAGALESPSLLHRSGIDRPGIGANLHDHPAVTLALRSVPGDAAARPSCSVIGTLDDPDAPLQLLPLNRTAPPSSSPPALLAGVLRQHGRGTLRFDDREPMRPPTLLSGFLDDERDRAALRRAGRVLAQLVELAAPEGAIAADPAVPDPHADDAAWDRWVDAQLGPYFHAAGTCRMGAPDDELAVVDRTGEVIGHRGVYVLDASVFPDQPAASPYLPTLALAELGATRLAEGLDA